MRNEALSGSVLSGPGGARRPRSWLRRGNLPTREARVRGLLQPLGADVGRGAAPSSPGELFEGSVGLAEGLDHNRGLLKAEMLVVDLRGHPLVDGLLFSIPPLPIGATGYFRSTRLVGLDRRKREGSGMEHETAAPKPARSGEHHEAQHRVVPQAPGPSRAAPTVASRRAALTARLLAKCMRYVNLLL